MRAGKVIFVQTFVDMKELITRSPYNPPVMKELITMLRCNVAASTPVNAILEDYESEDLFE